MMSNRTPPENRAEEGTVAREGFILSRAHVAP